MPIPGSPTSSSAPTRRARRVSATRSSIAASSSARPTKPSPTSRGYASGSGRQRCRHERLARYSRPMSAGLVGRDHEYVAVTASAVIQARADEDAAQAAENAKWLKYGQEWGEALPPDVPGHRAVLGGLARS